MNQITIERMAVARNHSNNEKENEPNINFVLRILRVTSIIGLIYSI